MRTKRKHQAENDSQSFKTKMRRNQEGTGMQDEEKLSVATAQNDLLSRGYTSVNKQLLENIAALPDMEHEW